MQMRGQMVFNDGFLEDRVFLKPLGLLDHGWQTQAGSASERTQIKRARAAGQTPEYAAMCVELPEIVRRVFRVLAGAEKQISALCQTVVKDP